ncbi:MAG: NADH-quinone oxidoreductase subunit C [Actinobacteria bacterium]|nr:NADH-quinone oxidoreductase subunit C [Actinomycetota bacterium]
MAGSRSPLAPPEIAERLRARFGEDVLDHQDVFGHAVVTVTPARYREVVAFLRDDRELAFDFFDFLGGVDYGERGIEVVTHLYSTVHNHHVRVKVRAESEDARVPTISDLYAGANWHEREAWELFGVSFEGHPHLVKLLLPEPFEGHPLRKDFELMSRVAKPWPGAVEGEEEEEEE